MFGMTKHYIRINESNEIIYGFSDVFEQPQEGDVLLRETNQMQFYLEDYIFNPILQITPNVFVYKYENGEVVKI